MMHLALVIPALNEEQAIAGTLRRALAAREVVIAQTPVQKMTIVFVNDGCTDRTQEIVDQSEFAEVVKVNYGRNRGYGAAIKAGFHATDADLVGFMDADGTCEPLFCVQLIQRMLATEADVVLAARLSPNTQMPLIRKIGNRIFATLLGVVSGKLNITDTASGFRICKRESLKLMSPLPDGLHFTPTQSAICLLDPRLKIQEVHGMHYKEREGRSKLRVIQDGFRFLWTILFSAACYAPVKTMLLASGLLTAVMILMLGFGLIVRGAEYVFPALLLALIWGLMVMVFMSTGLVAHELNFLLIGPRRRSGPAERTIQALMNHRRLILGGLTLNLLSLGLFLGLPWMPIPMSPMTAGLSTVTLVMLALLGATAVMGGVMVRVIWAVGQKQHALMADEYHIPQFPDSQGASHDHAVASTSPIMAKPSPVQP